MYLMGDLRHIRMFPEEDPETGEVEFRRTSIKRVPIHFQCQDGTTEDLTVTVTRRKGRELWNLTWPDGAKEGARERRFFVEWFAERFGAELAITLLKTVEGIA